MKKYPLGEFEEIVLLTVGVLFENAYGVTIKDLIEKRLERKVSVGALQSALRRMEKKGYLVSYYGEKTNERGGKRKRFFKMTSHGKDVLNYTRTVRNNLWDDIPDVALDF
ncbi:MAG: PadR family transcriptional regulator [Saprospiraceae bacterium]|nr:PadR family transcriptional regulator [Saprospiraceae bacterium]